MSKTVKVHKTVKGQVEATQMGHYGGKIIRAGEVFSYVGLGKFPMWVKVLKDESEVEVEAAPKKEAKKEKKSEVDSLV